MAMDPAAISARPARTITWAELTAPERPAAKAKGTVRPSDIPMTMSRTSAVAAKCVSTWAGDVGGAGVGSESIAIPEVYLSAVWGLRAGVGSGSLGVGAVVSHISRKTSEMWGTRGSGLETMVGTQFRRGS